MNWWVIAEMPINECLLPNEFLKAKNLWIRDADNNKIEIIKLLEPFLKSLFILENINNFKDFFDYDEGFEIPAERVQITNLNFDSGSVPSCSTEAFFSLKVKKSFDTFDLSDWQERNSQFSDAISFYWDLNINDFDASFGSHLGVECVPIRS